MREPTTSTIKRSTENKRFHLDYLDGLRGIAAAYVAVYHASMTARSYIESRPGEVSQRFTTAFGIIQSLVLNWGHWAVCVFIALSGYCLMLPIAKAGSLSSGLWPFACRRAKRILPPYYAALVIAIGAEAFWPQLQHGLEADSLSFGSISTHLFLIHDLFPHYIGKINAAMWSVAVEWHIYFIFALLMVPIWKKFGISGLLLSGVILGILLPAPLPWHPPMQMITVFSFGATAAVLSLRQHSASKINFWKYVSMTLFVLCGLLCALSRKSYIESEWGRAIKLGEWIFGWFSDVVVGAAVSSFFIFWRFQFLDCRDMTKSFQPLALRVLSSQPAIFLGACSYSLYLLHSPIINAVDLGIRASGIPMMLGLLLYLTLLPITVALAYFFSLLFERRAALFFPKSVRAHF